jgi:hypothetical protein
MPVYFLRLSVLEGGHCDLSLLLRFSTGDLEPVVDDPEDGKMPPGRIRSTFASRHCTIERVEHPSLFLTLWKWFKMTAGGSLRVCASSTSRSLGAVNCLDRLLPRCVRYHQASRTLLALSGPPSHDSYGDERRFTRLAPAVDWAVKAELPDLPCNAPW